MILVVALLAFFCVVGLTARRFGARTQWFLLLGIALLVALGYAAQLHP